MKATWSSNSTDMIVEECWSGFIVHRPSPSYVLGYILASVFNTTVGLIGTTLNSFVVFIFWKSEKMRKKISYMLIMVLSSTDLALVTIIPALHLLLSVTNTNETPNCLYVKCYEIASLILSGMSLMTFLVMNIDRYLAIVHPMFHHVAITKKKYMLILACFWFIVMVLTAVRVISISVGNTIISTICTIHVSTTLFTYISIFHVARKKLTKINPGNNDAVNNRDTSDNLATFLRELKLAKTYLLIVFMCFACYFPSTVVYAIWIPLENEKQIKNILIYAYPWMASLVVVNSTFNCLVFFWSNKELRKEATKIAKTFFRRE